MFVSSTGEEAWLTSDCAFGKFMAHCPLTEKGTITPSRHQPLRKKLPENLMGGKKVNC